MVHAEAAGPEGEWTLALSHIWRGTVSLLSGDPDGAITEIEQGLASARRRGDRLSAYIALYNLSQVELARGRHPEARRHLEEGIRLSLETGDHGQPGVPARCDGDHRGGRRHPRPGAAAGRRRPGASARPSAVHGYGYYRPDPRRSRAPVPRRAAGSGATGTTTPSTSAARCARRGRGAGAR